MTDIQSLETMMRIVDEELMLHIYTLLWANP